MMNSDLLTPDELDALLNEVDWGGLSDDEPHQYPQGNVVPYDFSVQEHILRSSMPALEIVYEKFSRRLRATLTGVLRRGTAVQLSRVETLRYSDWLAKLPRHCGMHLVKVRPLLGTGLFVLPSNLVYLFVDSYFGGRTEAQHIAQSREITSAELRVTRIIVDRIAKELEEAWSPIYRIAIEHVGWETNPLFANVASPGDRVIAARFGIRLGEVKEELSFAIPHSMVEPLRAQLDNSLSGEHSDQERRWRENLVENLLNVPLELRGTLVETVMPVRRILTMKPGDVIPVEIPERLPVDLEGTTVFTGELGAARGRNVVTITQVLHQEAEPKRSASAASSQQATPTAWLATDKNQGGFAACA
ncbi:flagellar motor switch protein FliM [Thioalkalicoccus limnaeus]|uniref:Flagellar motor switch protein FliM n=1 Tax=Thioalkalicoccus limnaeus TaxID=120681 RepID=A0ABV4BD46_9GAMM